MSRTLYLSDLDGTLLGTDGRLSEYTASIVQQFVELGGLFSIATARSPQMAGEVMRQLDLKVPVLLNNGAITYDPIREEFLEVASMPMETVEHLYEIFTRRQITGFMYVLENNTVKLFYQKLRGEEDQHYYDTRYLVYGGDMERCASLLETAQYYTPIFFVLYGSPVRLNDVHRELMTLPGISCTLYEDTYSGGKYYFVDIYSNKASKGIGMRRLKKMLNADRVAAFGDSYNDLEMLEQADAAYVPANGVGLLLQTATEIIPSCGEDGVAQFLARYL